ncbi:hypothetical protein LUZ62_070264 [Rhynchospora pubera]|uniref:Uncharacterized protein n=1 Tax=Rhynchospora pubera TaxID=906938 RepID=A0AAV8CW29_9POAL|nr:hypothetical protein LUZ62_070264 [Rhynchospora pubera]
MSKFQAKSFKVVKATHRGQKGRARVGIWPARLVHGFTKILLGFFSFPSSRPQISVKSSLIISKESNSADTPKQSCSANLHPLNQHYDEAIADCVEFFNKSSSQDIRLRAPNLEDL